MKSEIRNLLETSTELVDSISGLPLLKTIMIIGDQIIKIDDKQKAFVHAMIEVSKATFLEALLVNNISIKELNRQIDNIYINAYSESLKEQFYKTNTVVENFNFNDFNNNEIIKSTITAFVSDLLKAKLGLKETKTLQKIKKFITDNIEINFYKLLSDKEKVYVSFKTYIDSVEYELKRNQLLHKEYTQQLAKMFNGESVLNEEGVTLQDLYIEPNFYLSSVNIDPAKFNKKHEAELDHYGEMVGFDYSLHKVLNELLNGENEACLKDSNPQLFLILGFPGQGKSSFCKKFLFDYYYSESSTQVYFIRLRHLNQLKNLLDSPLETLRIEAEQQAIAFFNVNLTIKPHEFEKCTLVLDGLDELYMSGDFKEESVLQILRNILRGYLTKNKSLKIIITSRYGRINPEDLAKENAVVFSLMEFSLKQQLKWLKQYNAKSKAQVSLTKEQLTKINKDNRLRHLAELVSQPILLHMIAKLPEPVNEQTNKADIYNKLFTTLIDRSYDKTGKLDIHKDDDLDADDLREIIREIAFEIFNNDREYVHKDQLVNSNSPILSDFFRTKQGAENRLRLLMMSFYLKEVIAHDDDEHKDKIFHSEYAIEFLHKSLHEYLTAEKIWHSLFPLIETKLAFQKVKYIIEEHNWAEVIKIISKLFTKAIPHEISSYLSEIIENDKLIEKPLLFNRMILFLPHLLEKDFINNYNSESDNNLIKKCINIFNGYINVLFCNAHQSNIIPDGLLKKLSYFFSISKLKDLRFDNQNFQGIEIETNDIFNCNFDNSSLIEADFDTINFIECSFKFANLKDLDCLNSNFLYCNFTGAIFKYLDGNETRFQNCRGQKSDFSNADISDSNFTFSDFTSCNYYEISLKGSYINKCFFMNSNFENSDLRATVIVDSNFSNCSFKNAILSNTKFITTNLKNCNFDGANLWGAYLVGSDIIGATFKNAILSKSELSKKQLKYVTEQGALFPDVNPNEDENFYKSGIPKFLRFHDEFIQNVN